MKRATLIELLAKTVISGPGSSGYRVSVVILPRFECVKKFSKDFYAKLDEIPQWVQPDVERRLLREIEWPFGKIMFVSNLDHLKGISIDLVYRSDRVLSSGAKEHEYYNIMSVLRGNSIIDFEDKE